MGTTVSLKAPDFNIRVTHRVGGHYRVVITRPDGSESVEEVDESTELVERSAQLMNSLRSEGWRVA